jgi:hypothetical protein
MYCRVVSIATVLIAQARVSSFKKCEQASHICSNRHTHKPVINNYCRYGFDVWIPYVNWLLNAESLCSIDKTSVNVSAR